MITRIETFSCNIPPVSFCVIKVLLKFGCCVNDSVILKPLKENYVECSDNVIM